jgi:hypothetical protein
MQLMVITLEDARREATVLTYSWEIAMDNYSIEELGGLMFDTLFELAPNLRMVFRKPRPVW